MRIGLTGGIGSGKSTVAQALVQLGGWQLVDTDAISRALTQPGGAAMPLIAQRFGAGFVTADGALNRPAMRTLAFEDPSARHALEAILHPLIGEETERLALLAAPGQHVVFDVPLLVESGRWRHKLHRVLVVDCEETTQLQRVMQRSGLEEAQVRAIMAQQATRAQRRAAADAVLYNDGLSLDQLHQGVAALLTSPLF